MKWLLAILISLSVCLADELNSRIVVRHIDNIFTVYSITYKGQEYLVVITPNGACMTPVLFYSQTPDTKPSKPVLPEYSKFRLD